MNFKKALHSYITLIKNKNMNHEHMYYVGKVLFVFLIDLEI